MGNPNVPMAIAACRSLGLKFDGMSTSFFLSRKALRPAPPAQPIEMRTGFCQLCLVISGKLLMTAVTHSVDSHVTPRPIDGNFRATETSALRQRTAALRQYGRSWQFSDVAARADDVSSLG
jgi:hypothetical protein